MEAPGPHLLSSRAENRGTERPHCRLPPSRIFLWGWKECGLPRVPGPGAREGRGLDREASVGPALGGCRGRRCSVRRPPPPFCGIGHRLARPRSLRTQPCSAHQKFEQVSPMGDLQAPGPGSPCHACRGSEAGRCRLQRAVLSQCGILTYCHLISQVVQREKFLPGTWKLFYSISNAELMFTL